MIQEVFIITTIFFLAGGLGSLLIVRKKPEQKKELFLKYFVYLIVVYGVLSIVAFSEWKNILAAAIGVIGGGEIIYAWLRSERKKFLLLSAGVLGFSVIILLFVCGVYTFEEHFLLKLYTLVLTFDGFSQIFGQLAGTKKIVPKISPGKTLEGLAGGSMIALATGVFLLNSEYGMAKALFVSLMVLLFSFTGDLLASFYKRKCGIKDYSKLIPGHGGVLDRFDSFIFCVAALFATTLFLL